MKKELHRTLMQTRVTAKEAKKIDYLCNTYHFTRYSLIHTLLSAFMKFAEKESRKDLSPEVEKMCKKVKKDLRIEADINEMFAYYSNYEQMADIPPQQTRNPNFYTQK